MSIGISDFGYVSTGSVASEIVEVQFKDGMHRIPEAVVAHLGGTEVVKANAARFILNTYQEFLDGFWRLVADDTVRKALEGFKQGNFISFR